MCTRYLIELSPELRPIIEAARRSLLGSRMIDKLGKALKTSGEIRPTDMAPVIAPDRDGKQKVFPMVWGFTYPGFKNPVVNARVETASIKPSFKESWQRHRCVIPASCYFEWQHYESNGKMRTGDKYAIQPRGSNVTWLAGLYRLQEVEPGSAFPVFTVLTREPSEDIRKIHDRMPMILPEDALSEWINPSAKPENIKNIVHSSLTDMIAEKCITWYHRNYK